MQLTFDNGSEVELQNRIARSWRAFYKYRDLLCCRAAPWKNRLSLLNTVVRTSLFWCSGSWNLTRRQVSKLRGVQQHMQQKMLCLKRAPQEEQRNFMARLNSKIKLLNHCHQFQSWERWYYRSVLGWAGHVSRIRQYNEPRLTNQVLQFKSWACIQQVAAANLGNQLHGRRLHTWRWEQKIYNLFPGEDWQTKAQDKADWHQQLEQMISQSCRTR